MKRFILFVILIQSLRLNSFYPRWNEFIILQNETNSILEVETTFKSGSEINRLVTPKDFIVLYAGCGGAIDSYLNSIKQVYCYENDNAKYKIDFDYIKNLINTKEKNIESDENGKKFSCNDFPLAYFKKFIAFPTVKIDKTLVGDIKISYELTSTLTSNPLDSVMKSNLSEIYRGLNRPFPYRFLSIDKYSLDNKKECEKFIANLLDVMPNKNLEILFPTTSNISGEKRVLGIKSLNGNPNYFTMNALTAKVKIFQSLYIFNCFSKANLKNLNEKNFMDDVFIKQTIGIQNYENVKNLNAHLDITKYAWNSIIPSTPECI